MKNYKFDDKKNVLKTVFDRALTSKKSDFYRKKYYGKLPNTPLSDYSEFQKIPFLTRDEIIAVPWEKRNFAPESEIAYVAMTSGTTSQNKPMLVPISKEILIERSAGSDESILSASKAARLNVGRILCLIPGALNFYYSMMYFPASGTIPIPGNYQDLDATALMCQELLADGIITIPTLLLNLSDSLKKIGFPLTRIKWISLQGELVSEAKLKAIKATFPNAYVEFFYGSNEMTSRAGYQCQKRGFEPNTYHPGSKFFFEIVAEDGTTLPPGQTGTLVVTDLDADKPFPLIRYKTGDLATLEETDCKCGNNVLLKIGGREGYNNLRIFGVTFNTIVLEQALGKLILEVRNYTLYITEQKDGEKLKPKIVLKVSSANNFDTIKPKLEKAVRQNFYITKNKTIGELVDNGTFYSFTVEQMPPGSVKGKGGSIVLDI